jgi:hypothetical protein
VPLPRSSRPATITAELEEELLRLLEADLSTRAAGEDIKVRVSCACNGCRRALAHGRYRLPPQWLRWHATHEKGALSCCGDDQIDLPPLSLQGS